MPTLRALGLGLVSILASAALLTLALPLGEQAYLAWVALVPLLLAFRGRGFLVGFLSGLATVLVAAWLSGTGLLYAHRSPGSPVQIYAVYATYAVSFCLVLGFWGEPGTRRLPAWWFAALATLCEAILLFQIPAHLALTQYRQAFGVQVASVGGVWMVSTAVWWANFAFAVAFLEGRRSLLLVLPLVSIALGGAWLPASGSARRFAAVQVRRARSSTLRSLQKVATDAGATLIVWPELAGTAFKDEAVLRAVGGAPFVTSFHDGFKPLPHNVAAIFFEGRESARYAKRKLFGTEVRMHTPGNEAVTFGEVGLNVCFDSCFPEIIRETAEQGAEIVALPTVDPTSANDFVAAMHAAYSPFRAAESGVAIVRANEGAFSSIADARGRIVGERASSDGVLVAEAAVGLRWTVYRVLGDWWLWICGGLVAWGVVRSRQGGRRPEL